MTTASIEVSVRNDINEVSRTSQILSDFWAQHQLPPEAEMDATLALEEILSNVIRHGCDPGRDYDIRLRISLTGAGASEESARTTEPGSLYSTQFSPGAAGRAGPVRAYELEISDDATPFNPLLRPDPNLDLPIEQRTPGGLGIFLVKQLADDLRYEFRDGRNILTFRKNLPAGH